MTATTFPEQLGLFRLRGFVILLLCNCWAAKAAQIYPLIRPFQKTIAVPDVDKADVSLIIRSDAGRPMYRLQCHHAGYTGGPDFDYSGDFECRLSTVGAQTSYGTLLTEDANQSRDWESRGRFFATDLISACAEIPEFGATRSFQLRAMMLTLRVFDVHLSGPSKVAIFEIAGYCAN